MFLPFIIIFVITNGDVAQLARANGSYPLGQRFESTHRYQNEQSTLNGRFIFLHNKNKCGFEKDVPEQSEGKNSPGGLFLGRGLANPLIATK